VKHQTIEEAAEHASLYVLGALDEEETRRFEAHLAEGCEACADEVSSFNPVIASLGDCHLEASPSPLVRERLAAFLNEEARTARRPAPSPAATPTQMLKVRADEGEWDQIAKGVFRKFLFEDRRRGTTTSLIKVQAGAQIPSHPHDGIEECVVLEGDIYTETDTFTAGDYLCAPAGSTHEQLFSMNGAILFIVAAGAATV
jgi:anti-sigma factor ChrR (cupin superfamily)